MLDVNRVVTKEGKKMRCFFRVLTTVVVVMFVAAGFAGSAWAGEKAAGLDYPKKGRILTIIVPYPAGGGADTDARIMAPLLEKKMGIPVQVVNKPGAGTQVGMTELTSSKPDGYTLLLGHFPGAITPHLDPTRKAVYTRKDFKAVAFMVTEPWLFCVPPGSPYKTIKDVVDYAKANPEKYKIAVTGILLPPHMSVLMLENEAGVKFAAVHFDGSATLRTAFLGGHTDAMVVLVSEAAASIKGGQARAIGVMDTEEHPHHPGVKTIPAQGYNVVMVVSEGILAPGGTPSEIIKYLENAFKEVAANETYIAKMKELGITIRFMNASQSEEHLTSMENRVRPLIEAVRKKEQ
jgi:tripartite-type tricarboxylate transporter receptor subunit TctC